MRIGIIGGGASGVFAAIRIKELHPEYDVIIFERNDKLLKKIYATGNGRCNFANSSSFENAYNNESFANEIVSEFDSNKLASYFDSIGIKSRLIGDLYYPYSLSASTVAEKLLCRLSELNISVILNFIVKSYENIKGGYLVNDSEKVDVLIFACGGKSYPQLGTDGSIFSVLEKHNYNIEKLSPSLCPIKVKENVTKLDGVRVKASVSLFDKNDLVYQEDGEVQFRSDAISGIVIFNMSFMINKLNLPRDDIRFSINFVPEIHEKIPMDEYGNYLNNKLSNYLISNKLDIHNTFFSFKSFYSFDSSQVTSGGICLKNVKSSLESVKENNVFFIGEILDVDARCGGFNLMWAFASAEKVALSLC